jgi:hypothetical protein
VQLFYCLRYGRIRQTSAKSEEIMS